MSFDMFVQAFHHGAARAMSRDAFDAVFGEHIDRSEPDRGYHHVSAPDGGAASLYVHLDDDAIGSVVIDHFSPGHVLDLVAEFARRADAVIVPVGGAVLLTRQSQARHLPEELRADTLVINTGAEIDAALAAS